MKPLRTLGFGILGIIFGALNLLYSGEATSELNIKERRLTSHPVTNESVEAGLRKNREALRA